MKDFSKMTSCSPKNDYYKKNYEKQQLSQPSEN